MIDHCHQSSFEGALRNIFDKGEFFCNRCMEILANYVDVDKLVSPEVDHEQLYPTKQNQKVTLTAVSLKTISLTPSMPPRQREIVKKAPEPPVPQIPIQALETISIFQNEKFQKLCALLEKGLEVAEAPKPEPLPQPAPQIVVPQRNELEDHILAERIRELSEDLRLSQQDLKEHQQVIHQIASKYKAARNQLSLARKTIGDLQRQVSHTESLKVVSVHPRKKSVAASRISKSWSRRWRLPRKT